MGGHSALDVCRGAKKNGFRTVAVSIKGREQTYLKHLVLENYLERLSWIIGFGSEYGKICYVDGFSGPWKSGSEDYEDTSIRISLDILSKTKSGLQELGKSVKFKCIFVEKEI